MAKNSALLLDIGQGLSIMVGLPRIASWDTNTRPKNPKTGTFGFNSYTKSLEYWDGNSWFSAAMKQN
jgi:hypothetical protein